MSEPIQKHRDTRFEIGQITLTPNGLEFRYAERGVPSNVLLPPLTIPEGKIPDELIVRFRDMMGELELQIAEEYAEWEATPQAAQEATAQAMRAREAHDEAVKKTNELTLLWNANVDLVAAKKAEADKLAADVAAKKVELEVLENTLTAARAAAAQEKSNGR
jgi:hypothetical protein